MKKILAAVWFNVLLTAGLALPAVADGPTDGTHFKIGFILSQSGFWAEYGEAQKLALEMARRDRAELFRNIDFIYEDCEHAPRLAVSAFNKLLNVDHADLIFVWGVEPSRVVAPLAERRRQPLIVAAIDPETARGRNYVIRTINYAEQYARALLSYFRSRGHKHLAVISSDLSFHNLLLADIRKNLAPDESLHLAANLLPHEKDFSSVVTRLKREQIDVLGLFLNPSQIIQYYRYAEAQGVSFPIFGIQTFQSRSLVRAAGGSMDGAIFPHNLVKEWFAERFIAAAGQDMQLPWAANAYDFAVLAGEILSRLPIKPPPEELIELFGSIGPRQGAGGSFQAVYKPEVGRYFEYPIVMKQIVDGNFVQLGEDIR